MEFKALGFGIKKEHKEIIEKISENILEIPLEIIDTKSAVADIDPLHAILYFGQKALKIAPPIGKVYVVLPELHELEAIEGNEEKREEAYKKLLAFKEELHTFQAVTTAKLPELNCSEIVAIENALKATGQTSWQCKTKEGKLLYVTLEPTRIPDAFSITFAELYALKMAIEYLKIEEIVLKA